MSKITKEDFEKILEKTIEKILNSKTDMLCYILSDEEPLLFKHLFNDFKKVALVYFKGEINPLLTESITNHLQYKTFVDSESSAKHKIKKYNINIIYFINKYKDISEHIAKNKYLSHDEFYNLLCRNILLRFIEEFSLSIKEYEENAVLLKDIDREAINPVVNLIFDKLEKKYHSFDPKLFLPKIKEYINIIIDDSKTLEEIESKCNNFQPKENKDFITKFLNDCNFNIFKAMNEFFYIHNLCFHNTSLNETDFYSYICRQIFIDFLNLLFQELESNKELDILLNK